ncbi:Scr1 family TA system antitoxin-like transcriptional regulator [Streptomyces rubradiris]|uniref:Scr1 family TA system antitoxin-like transcriptional regulator n=1 Tax=Streptomyces rubradiris TaxID=285531 RepID=UPI0036EFC7DA
MTAPAPLHDLPAAAALPAPIEIVVGVYLRALREANGRSLADAALWAQVSVSTISRLERAENSLSPHTLESLLHYYGVPEREIEYLQSRLPRAKPGTRHVTTRSSRVRKPSGDGDLFQRGRWDKWVDVAGGAAVARYAAVARAASETVYYTLFRIPTGYRTPAYREAINAPESCPHPDEPAEAPSWLEHVRHSRPPRRVLLLDETVLRRPVAGPEAMAGQLRHLLDLMDGRDSPGPVSIRVLPCDRPSEVIQFAGGEVGAFTVHGNRLIAGMHTAPWYETGSAYAHTLHEALQRAVEEAAGEEDSYALITSALFRAGAHHLAGDGSALAGSRRSSVVGCLARRRVLGEPRGVRP